MLPYKQEKIYLVLTFPHICFFVTGSYYLLTLGFDYESDAACCLWILAYKMLVIFFCRNLMSTEKIRIATEKCRCRPLFGLVGYDVQSRLTVFVSNGRFMLSEI